MNNLGYAPFVMPDKNIVYRNRIEKDREAYVHVHMIVVSIYSTLFVVL